MNYFAYVSAILCYWRVSHTYADLHHYKSMVSNLTWILKGAPFFSMFPNQLALMFSLLVISNIHPQLILQPTAVFFQLRNPQIFEQHCLFTPSLSQHLSLGFSDIHAPGTSVFPSSYSQFPLGVLFFHPCLEGWYYLGFYTRLFFM